MPSAIEIPDEEAVQLADAPLPGAIDAVQPRPSGLPVDTLASSVVVLLALAAIQRIVGFVRGILVCRWLSPDDLGQWDMAFGFLTLAAPLTVLGLPGSFGRYVEYFRQRGQLRTLIRRTAICSGILTVLSVGLIISARSLFSTIVFGRSNETQLVVVLGISLVAVIVFNYLTELITALRQARVTAVVQFFNSVIFAGVSLLLLWSWRREATALVAAYGFACLVQIVGMLWFLRRQYRALPASQAADFSALPETDGFWSRLLPFAAWVWVCNLLYNLFDVADRYMIVHTSRADDPLAVVGSYHSSRIVPLLLVSIAALLGTMILPHLSHDWEAGRRNEVSARMNLTLKLLGLLLFVGSIAILLAAPFLFNVAFNGKFRGGMDVLPWTLAYCAWFGMVTMAQMYLWCAERARLSCLALFIGLVTNVGLNLILLPRFGLAGAVWATAAANFIALALIYRFNAWLGMKIERSLLLVSLLPLTLGLGLLTAIATLAAVIVAIIATDQILSRDEKRRLTAVWQSYAHRLPFFRASRLALAPWPGGIVEPSPALPVWGPGLNNGWDEAQIVSTDAAVKSSSRPLRVMFVITSMHVGGAETLLLNLLRRIDRSRFSPELCCLKELGELGEQLQHEIPVYEKLLRNKFDIGVFWRLTRLLRRRQIDAVVTVGAGDKMFWGRLAARRWGAGRHFSAPFHRLARQHYLAESPTDAANRCLHRRRRSACKISRRTRAPAVRPRRGDFQRRRYRSIRPRPRCHWLCQCRVIAKVSTCKASGTRRFTPATRHPTLGAAGRHRGGVAAGKKSRNVSPRRRPSAARSGGSPVFNHRRWPAPRRIGNARGPTGPDRLRSLPRQAHRRAGTAWPARCVPAHLAQRSQSRFDSGSTRQRQTRRLDRRRLDSTNRHRRRHRLSGRAERRTDDGPPRVGTPARPGQIATPRRRRPPIGHRQLVAGADGGGVRRIDREVLSAENLEPRTT